MLNRLAPYRKTVTAVVVSAIGWAGVVITSPVAQVTAAEWLGLATAVATTLGVYAIPNERSK